MEADPNDGTVTSRAGTGAAPGGESLREHRGRNATNSPEGVGGQALAQAAARSSASTSATASTAPMIPRSPS
jgi:hypothetical protein